LSTQNLTYPTSNLSWLLVFCHLESKSALKQIQPSSRFERRLETARCTFLQGCKWSRRFAEIRLISNRIPDGTKTLTFCHHLKKNRLGEQIMDTVKAHLTRPPS
jgi:hypothetical protein